MAKIIRRKISRMGLLSALGLGSLICCQSGPGSNSEVFELMKAKTPRQLYLSYLWEFEQERYWEVTQKIGNSVDHVFIGAPDSPIDTTWPARRDSLLESYRRIDTPAITEIMNKSVERHTYLEWKRDSSAIMVESMIKYKGRLDELRMLGIFETISSGSEGYCLLEFPLNNLPTICELESVIFVIVVDGEITLPIDTLRNFIVTPVDSE